MKFTEVKKKFSSDDLDSLLRAERLPFKRTKQEAWQEVANRTQTATVFSMESKRSYTIFKVAAVAIVLIAAAGFGLLLAGNTTIENMGAEVVTVSLPDGSEASLNGASSLSYNEWYWKLQRSVALEGEAFFEVEKGSTFTVASALGDVRVLGTSFNVRSGAGIFEVQCKTGRVAVDLPAGTVYNLIPGKSILSKSGEAVLQDIPISAIGTWIIPLYSFDNVPVTAVFDTLSDNIGYDFQYNDELTVRYTGEFARSQEIEDILEIVCKPVGLDFEIDKTNKLITILKK